MAKNSVKVTIGTINELPGVLLKLNYFTFLVSIKFTNKLALFKAFISSQKKSRFCLNFVILLIKLSSKSICVHVIILKW